MYRIARFLLPLILVLGILTWVASTLVARVSRTWFERDLALRAELAVNGARRALVVEWPNPVAVRAELEDIARDARIMAAAACRPDFEPVASTPAYPASLSCRAIGERIARERGGLAEAAGFAQVMSVGRSEVHVTAVPLRDETDRVIGTVLVIHDLTFVFSREAATQRFYLVGFGVLALLASVATALITRASWRSFSRGLRELVRGGARRPEFAPLLSDVRELVGRIAAEAENVGGEGSNAWTPARIKQILTRHLHGERIIIVANREPYIHMKEADGSIRVQHPASGLVSALEPVMRACSGVWIAHGGGSADRETADEHGRELVPPGENLYIMRRVWLTPEEEQGYYYGFANEGLWPLCHLAHARPVFRSDDYAHYAAVNERFADAVVEEADTDDPVVLVQDYHFALAPRLIRERLPRATILSFWHIPWPNAERLGICPVYTDLLEGMLGSSILGFHTRQHCNNFLDAVDRYLEARIDREENAIIYRGRSTLVRPYPISVEWPSRWLSGIPSVEACRKAVIEQHGLPPGTLIGVGVDRIDYTKGIEERLLAVERMLERRPDLRGRFTFIQLGAPSRTKIGRYRDLNDDIDRVAARINERFAGSRCPPVIIHRAHHEPPTVFRYYRAADVCYVSSLHDGMNLVAKDFVSARDDERGVLVLSRFTGAARELTEALIVNPYDLEEASSALLAALDMSKEEQRERMRALRTFVAEWNVYRWAGRMLVDASRVRRGDQLVGRLTERQRRPALIAPPPARPLARAARRSS